MHIFVGNLDARATQEQLGEIFATFGKINSVRIVSDPFTGRPRGFAFIEMPEQAHAEDAIDKLNNSSFHGQLLTVNEARPRNNDDIFGKQR